jgi:hypothetical protein
VIGVVRVNEVDMCKVCFEPVRLGLDNKWRHCQGDLPVCEPQKLVFNQTGEHLRDRFAMAALTGMLASDNLAVKRGFGVMPDMAKAAFTLADSMMEERSRAKKG